MEHQQIFDANKLKILDEKIDSKYYKNIKQSIYFHPFSGVFRIIISAPLWPFNMSYMQL